MASTIPFAVYQWATNYNSLHLFDACYKRTTMRATITVTMYLILRRSEFISQHIYSYLRSAYFSLRQSYVQIIVKYCNFYDVVQALFNVRGAGVARERSRRRFAELIRRRALHVVQCVVTIGGITID